MTLLFIQNQSLITILTSIKCVLRFYTLKFKIFRANMERWIKTNCQVRHHIMVEILKEFLQVAEWTFQNWMKKSKAQDLKTCKRRFKGYKFKLDPWKCITLKFEWNIRRKKNYLNNHPNKFSKPQKFLNKFPLLKNLMFLQIHKVNFILIYIF